MDDIFISYSHEDRKPAEALHKRLDTEGWDVWWDEEIRIGKKWGDVLATVLGQAKAVVVLWTKNSVESEWVIKEATHAYEHNKLFSVKLEDCEVPKPFSEIQWADLYNWRQESDHRGFLRLLRSLAECAPPTRIDTLRPGYDSSFLGEDRRIAWPNVHGTARQLHYLHFSVVMNPARRLAWYVAYNVDLQSREKLTERRDQWDPDPLVPEELQPGNQHFKQSGFDRGHLVARYNVAWGVPRQAQIASHQAFFWTNTAPQHPSVNRGSYLAVEMLERELSERHGRLVGFCGPVLQADDQPFRDEQPGDDGFVAYGTFRIPRAFWKVLVITDEEGKLAHRAFWFNNPGTDEPVTRGRPKPDELSIEIAKLAEVTGLEFPAELVKAPLLRIT